MKKYIPLEQYYLVEVLNHLKENAIHLDKYYMFLLLPIKNNL